MWNRWGPSFVFPISGTELKDKESCTKVVQGTKREQYKSISLGYLEATTMGLFTGVHKKGTI
jgi:hypothetical protein